MTETASTPFPTVAFVGMGLIAGSLAKLVRMQLPQTRIIAMDNIGVVDAALFEQVIDLGLTELDEQIYAADLIVLGTHPHTAYQLVPKLVEQAPGPLFMMDIGSTKTEICRLVESIYSPDFQFIGGHPLAGREVSGYHNSLPNLFINKRFFITPCGKTSPPFEKRVLQWLNELGTLPLVIDYAEHDRLMGLMSHFPQFYAIALGNLLNRNKPEYVMQFLGGGIDDQLRLMTAPHEMWRNVWMDNRKNMVSVLDQFLEIMTHMRQALIDGEMEPWLDQSETVHQIYQEVKKNR